MSDDIENIESYTKKGKEAMDSSIQRLNSELVKIRAGKATPSMLDGIMVDYYGNPTPLSQVANLGTPDSKTISIQPWEKPMLAAIEQAIFAANLGLTPMNDGEFVRIIIPPMTEERRRDLVKQTFLVFVLGMIPKELCQMSNLVNLDCSFNKLDGECLFTTHSMQL